MVRARNVIRNGYAQMTYSSDVFQLGVSTVSRFDFFVAQHLHGSGMRSQSGEVHCADASNLERELQSEKVRRQLPIRKKGPKEK